MEKAEAVVVDLNKYCRDWYRRSRQIKIANGTLIPRVYTCRWQMLPPDTVANIVFMHSIGVTRTKIAFAVACNPPLNLQIVKSVIANYKSRPDANLIEEKIDNIGRGIVVIRGQVINND